MEVVSIINRKGGVGKTATSLALGAGLLKRGFSVLFIDLDSQTNLSTGLDADLTGPNSLDLLLDEVSAKKAIQHTAQGDIIPASENLAKADVIIDGTGKEYRLKEAISKLDYDYVIIDTPAALGTLTVNALTASNSVVIPVQADTDSLQGLGQLNKAIVAVKKYCNHDLFIRGILITRFYGRPVISRDMRENFEGAAAQLGTKLYSVPIRECVSIREAKAERRDIFSYAPKSNAAKDYNEFIDEFLADSDT